MFSKQIKVCNSIFDHTSDQNLMMVASKKFRASLARMKNAKEWNKGKGERAESTQRKVRKVKER